MLKIKFIILIILMCLVSACGGSVENITNYNIFDSNSTNHNLSYDWLDIYNENIDKTVRIEVINNRVTKSGSGFFVKNDIIVTNYHLVDLENIIRIRITLHDGTRIYGRGIDDSLERRDIAFIKVDPQNIEPVIIGQFDSINILDNIMNISNPLDLEWSANLGYVSAFRYACDVGADWVDGDTELIQFDILCDHGSSGSLILNIYGEVIAIEFAGYADVIGEFRFGISIDYILSKLEDDYFVFNNI